MITEKGCEFEYGIVRKFQEQDLASVMFDLIDEDIEFISKIPGNPGPAEHVYSTVMSSLIAFSILNPEEKVMSIVGARASGDLGSGDLWFFSSSEFFKTLQAEDRNFAASFEFLRRSIELIDFIQGLFPVLKCFSVKTNKIVCRRNELMGFKLSHSCENFNYYTRSYDGRRHRILQE